MTHTHSTSTLDWGFGRIGSHLSTEHGMAIPMAWTVGQMHEAHLRDHAALPPAEEAPMPMPMPMPKDHDDIETRAQAYYEAVQEYPNPPGWDDVDQEIRDYYRHLVRQKLTEHTEPVPEEKKLAEWEEAEGLFLAEYPGGDWNDLQQETRDYWRTQVRVRADRKALAEALQDDAEHQQREGEYRIREDRFISAMAGLDFDTQWAADSGIGPSARGLLREQYGTAAKRLLKVIDRGGMPDLIVPSDVFRQIVHERAEQGKRIAALETEVKQLRKQLEQITTGNQRNVGSIDALEAELAGVRDQRFLAEGKLERAIEAGRQLEAQRDQAQHDLETERSIVSELEEVNESFRTRTLSLEARLTWCNAELEAARQELGATRERLHKRTHLLDEGRSRLREIIAEMAMDHLNETPPNVPMLIEALEGIVGGTVSTAKPIGLKCREAHLGLATTGEMLTEITTRIDLGHCGLDYRTVNGD